MPYVRKITRGRWPGEKEIEGTSLESIEADTITSEFKTDHNKLSVWKIESDDDLNDIFLALASNCEFICSISVVKINDVDLDSLSIEKELGNTPTFDINEKHRNISNLTYQSLGIVVTSIINAFISSGFIRKTKGDMKQILIDAYQKNKLKLDCLSPTLLNEIEQLVH